MFLVTNLSLASKHLEKSLNNFHFQFLVNAITNSLWMLIIITNSLLMLFLYIFCVGIWWKLIWKYVLAKGRLAFKVLCLVKELCMMQVLILWLLLHAVWYFVSHYVRLSHIFKVIRISGRNSLNVFVSYWCLPKEIFI